MELYFKNLISDDASLEKLVDDVTEVVEGADHFASTIGAGLSEQSLREVASRLDRLKASSQRLKKNAIASAHAADKLVHERPYSFLGLAALAGILAGLKLGSGRRRKAC